MKRQPLNHEDCGRRIERISSEIFELANLAGAAYGAAYCDKALAILRRLDRLRIALEDKMAAERVGP